MDQRAWLWRKKSSEMTIVTTDKVVNTLKQFDEQVPILGSERSMKNLNKKLASVLFDCHPKDELMTKQANLVLEADAGQEKLEADAVFVKKELDEALRPQLATNEILPHLCAASVKCVKQLNFVQEEEQRVHDAVIKTSGEFEKVQKELEKNLREANERIAKLVAVNSHMSKALLFKEKSIEDLSKSKSQAEAELSTRMSRLDATEKENAFLKYEFRILEKEIEIRNEEMEYTRRSVEATNKQHFESVKKVTKLEEECERLCLLVRKKLPHSAASANMKSEVAKLGRDQTDMRRRALNPSRDLIVRQATLEGSHEISLVERLHDMKEENKTLKEIVTTNSTELQASRMMFSRTASRLSYVESQLKEICTGKKSMELTSCVPISSDLSIMLVDNASDDGISSSGSWANALISELEHFRDGKIKNQLGHKGIEVSDMSLMDDFVEMEKLAIVSSETHSGGSYHPDVTSKELVPLVRSDSSLSETKQEIHSIDIASERSFDWLQVVLNAMLKQRQISKQSLDELLEDIRIALGYVNYPTVVAADSVATSKHPREPKSHITPSPISCSLGGDSGIGKERSSQHLENNLSESICKIIKLVEGVNVTSSVSDPYCVHVFQWNSTELHAVLQKFVCACNDLLRGKADLEKFSGELLCDLDWIMNSCIAPKDASRARNKVKKHFGLLVESNMDHIPEEKSSTAPLSLNDQNVLSQNNLQEENMRLKDQLKSMETRLDSATDKSVALMTRLHESGEQIGSLETEVETLKESKEMIEDQMENQKSTNEDLDTQLIVAKAKLNEVFQKFSSLQVELEYKNNCCEELEATCLELQLQLESVAKKETSNYGVNQEGKQSQNGWEITAASVKLAECQETILNLGKQLKALASPREALHFDKVFSTANPSTNNKKLNQQFSLHDKILADESAETTPLKSSNTKTTLCIENAPKPSLLHSCGCDAVDDPSVQVHTPEAHIASKNKTGNTAVGSSLAIVPSKKRGVGLLMKLFLRRKKRNSANSRSLAKV